MYGTKPQPVQLLDVYFIRLNKKIQIHLSYLCGRKVSISFVRKQNILQKMYSAVPAEWATRTLVDADGVFYSLSWLGNIW